MRQSYWRRAVTPIGIAVPLVLSVPAYAQVWNEVGEATDLPPGQMTTGVGPLLTINGTISQPDNDVDLYCIHISDPQSFSATEAGLFSDNSLYLFDAAAFGVAFHGEDDGVGSPPVIPQAMLTSSFVGPAGDYLLAIAPSGRDPRSGPNEMWLDAPPIERPADGPGAGGPLTNWGGVGFGLVRPYTVTLTGAEYCQVPEPGVLGALACLALLATRRR